MSDADKERVQHMADSILSEQTAAQALQACQAPQTAADLDRVNASQPDPTGIGHKRKSGPTPPKLMKRTRPDEQYPTVAKIDQDTYEKLILRATVSANLPFTWIQDPEVRRLFNQVTRPGTITIPSPRSIENRVLKAVDEEVKMRGDGLIRGSRFFTLSMGSWQNVKRHRILATNVITMDRKLVPAVDVAECDAERKNGSGVADRLRVVLERLDRFEGSSCVGIVTDPAAECRKGRRLVLKDRPSIIGVDSAPHQVSLLAANMVRAVPWTAGAISDLIEVIEFWNDHPVPVSRLWYTQNMIYGRRVSLKTPSSSCWTSYLDAVQSVLDSEKAMRAVITDEHIRNEILASFAGTADGPSKATRVIIIMESDTFWQRVWDLQRVLRPLCRAYEAVQRQHASMDTTLFTFAQLLFAYAGDPDSIAASTMMQAIENRWAKTDQALYVLTYVLHPARHMRHLNEAEPTLQPHLLAQQAARYYEQLLQEKPDGLLGDFAKYLHKHAPFNPEVFEDKELTKDPVLFWEMFKSAAPSIAVLALRLFAVSLDAGVLEQVFHEIDHVHDCRTLHHDKLAALVRVKSQLAADQQSAGSAHRNSIPGVSPTGLPLWPHPTANALMSPHALAHPLAGPLLHQVGSPHALLGPAGVLPGLPEEGAIGWELGADTDDDVIAGPVKSREEWGAAIRVWTGGLDDEYDTQDPVDAAEWGTPETRCALGKLFLASLPSILVETVGLIV
ncbi:hypothetical protein HK104_001181 [Borealophlyctis nickersoniae]|nr:hypothetical protein HK104_001181 [Borealophlyctis nickersoniae]